MPLAFSLLRADSAEQIGRLRALIMDGAGPRAGPRPPIEALETATGAVVDPLTIIISTQAPSNSDLLSILIDDAKAGHDLQTILSLHTAPPELDPFDIETIRLANPALGQFLNEKEVKEASNNWLPFRAVRVSLWRARSIRGG